MNDDKFSWMLAKLALVLGLFGISTWSEAAAAVSTVLGLSILTRFYWRNVWRPLLEKKGILRRKRRRATDVDDSMPGGM